jgi:hypothetical protein
MNAAEIIKELVRWLPIAWQLRELFGGDTKKALAAVRKVELDQRKARDKRMGR